MESLSGLHDGNYGRRALLFQRPLVRDLLLWALLLSSGASYAQNLAASAAEAASTIRVSTRFVMVDALVENKKTGSVVGELQQGDFRLSEDGVPQTITYFSEDRLPLSVVFLFDLTDTVRSALKPLAEGARELLSHLKPADEVAIMIFSSHVDVLQGFTTDRALAAAAIQKASGLETKEGTFIHEDMYQAVQNTMQSTTPGSRRVMIWLTDGSTNSQNPMTQKMIGSEGPAYLHTKEEATEALLHSGVVVSALIERTADTDFAVINPFMRIVGNHMGDIRRYAELTGGPVLHTSRKQIAARLAQLVDQIRLRYTLGYKPSTEKPDGTFCRLQLKLNPDGDRAKLRVETREGYYR